MTTIVVRRVRGGGFVEILADGSLRPVTSEAKHTGEPEKGANDLEDQGATDLDARPLSKEALQTARRGPHPRFVRKRLGLSVEEFADRYHFPVETLRAWENHSSTPDVIARSYLKAIAADPDGVAAAVASKSLAAE